MKPRTLAILAGTLALLTLGWALLQRSSERVASPGTRLLFPGFDVSEVTRLDLRVGTTETTLETSDGLWTISPMGHKADQNAVTELLEKLKTIRISDVASTNPAKTAVFEVSPDHERVASVSAFSADKTLVSFFIGKSGPDFSSNYVRLADSDETLRTATRIRQLFDKAGRGWRDRQVFDFLSADIEALEFDSPELTAAVQSKADEGAQKSWSLVGAHGSEPLDVSKVDSVLQTLANLRTDDFGEAGLSLEDAGLASPERTLKLVMKDGSQHELWTGGKTESGSVYAKTADSDTIYTLGSYRIGQIFKSPDELKPTPAEPATAE